MFKRRIYFDITGLTDGANSGTRLRLLSLLIVLCLVSSLRGASFKSVLILNGEGSGEIEKNVASLLAERIAESGDLPVRIATNIPTASRSQRELVILLGLPTHHAEIRRLFDAQRLESLTNLSPGPEGFLLRTVPDRNGLVVIIAAQDSRGLLYGAGEMLRQMAVHGSILDLPPNINLRTAPAFEIRGTQFGQSSVALNRAKVTPWTQQQRRHAILDLALTGLNTVEVGEGIRADDPVYRLVRSFNLKTLIHYYPNVGEGPPQWRAVESIGRPGYLCP